MLELTPMLWQYSGDVCQNQILSALVIHAHQYHAKLTLENAHLKTEILGILGKMFVKVWISSCLIYNKIINFNY